MSYNTYDDVSRVIIQELAGEEDFTVDDGYVTWDRTDILDAEVGERLCQKLDDDGLLELLVNNDETIALLAKAMRETDTSYLYDIMAVLGHAWLKDHEENVLSQMAWRYREAEPV